MTRRIATLMVATVLSWCATASLAAAGADAASASAFAAKAAASGVRMTVELPGAPATDTPVDGGGPTAQASLSSVGESIGYAAFPDPGGLVISAPGLIAGLSQSPISPPEYPLFVSSDATTRPSASTDAGPYALTAASAPTSSRAAATAGVSSDPAGTVGRVASVATVTSAGGRLVSVGTTEVEGLAVGPLTVGHIRSTAQFVQDPGGSRTPSSDLELSGVKVADTSIQVTTDGLKLANGATIPLPVGATADKLLKAQGITVDVLGVSATNGTVVSPALRIRFPSTVPDLGTAIVTMVIGNSVASLTSLAGSAATPAGGGTIGADTGTGTPTGVAGGVGVPGRSSGPGGPTVTGVTAVASSADLQQTRTGLWIPPQLSMDISGLYLVCVLALVVVLVVSLLIRPGGVRARWRS